MPVRMKLVADVLGVRLCVDEHHRGVQGQR